MKVARTIAELDLPKGQRIGFVPTMGAFHEGHLSLMAKAKAECGYCAVSLFVNPTQFAPHEDLSKYPRPEAQDFALAEQTGVDLLFAPSVEEVYGDNHTSIHVAGVTERWEGAIRPGHFDGVATVVAKLFNMVRPTDAYFGCKDFQQCAVIAQMVHDLNIPVDLHFEPTIREADGLALSSRNVYLSPEERAKAPILFATLSRAAAQIRGGENVDNVLQEGRSAIAEKGFEIQYFACVDAKGLDPVEQYRDGLQLIVAAKLGSTRLIDNVPVG